VLPRLVAVFFKTVLNAPEFTLFESKFIIIEALEIDSDGKYDTVYVRMTAYPAVRGVKASNMISRRPRRGE